MTINELLTKARKLGASDIHVSVGIPVKCRVNGELVNLTEEKILPADSKTLVEQMIPGRLVERFNKEGEVDFSYAIKGVGRFRVNIFKQRGTMAFVIRLVNTVIPSPETLGLPQSVLDLVLKKRGLILVTGPTGSGKSTTLASLINIINQTQNKHIITLEDPIEYLHTHAGSIVNQREVGIDTQSYAGALRAALREDPDIILVGAMRDLDTIATAVTAAETGHLVFSTLHTTGSAKAVDRIIDVFPPSQQRQIADQLSMVHQAVVSQLLVPTKQGTLMPAFELMTVTPDIRSMIRGKKIPQIDGRIYSSPGTGQDMFSMDNWLLELYRKDVITRDTALEHATLPRLLGPKLA